MPQLIAAIKPKIKSRILHLTAVVIGTLTILALSTAPSYAQTGHLPAYAESDFGCGKWMTSDATYLREENRIVGHTRLSNDCQLAGFHGAVVAVLANASDEVVGYGTPNRYGIDGRGPCWPEVVSWWPFKTEWRCPPTVERDEYWTDAIDPLAAGTATSLTLVQYRAPNSWLESQQSLRIHLEEAVAIAKPISEIVAFIALL